MTEAKACKYRISLGLHFQGLLKCCVYWDQQCGIEGKATTCGGSIPEGRQLASWLYFQSNSLLMAWEKKQRMAPLLGPSTHEEDLDWSSRLQSSAWPHSRCCCRHVGSEPADRKLISLSLSLSLFLSPSPGLTYRQINKSLCVCFKKCCFSAEPYAGILNRSVEHGFYPIENSEKIKGNP